MMKKPEELLQELQRRKAIVHDYYENYLRALSTKELSKASEYLWGIVNNLLYALSLLMRGKGVSSHREARELINFLSHVKGDGELPELFHEAEMLHANYFHNFMDEVQFEHSRRKVERLIAKLEHYIAEELKAKGLTSPL